MKLVIIGAIGYAKVVADIAEQCGYTEIIFLDDNESIKSCKGFPVVGKLSAASDYRDANFFVAIGNPITRERVMGKLEEDGMHIVTLVHPNSVVAKDVSVGIGTAIMAGAIINPSAKIGRGCIIDTGGSIDHDDVVEDFVHVAVGSHLAGAVYIGKRTWVGAGAVVSNDISICEDCMIGAGTVVIRDIDIAGTYVGVPARKIKG